MRSIHTHIIHCSDSTSGDVAAIRAWHVGRGWRDVGYHFIIRRDGEIEVGRQLWEVGAHARGHNSHSVGTCLIGKGTFTEAQFVSLRKLHAGLQALFGNIEAKPHNAFTRGKTCPNFEISNVLEV